MLGNIVSCLIDHTSAGLGTFLKGFSAISVNCVGPSGKIRDGWLEFESFRWFYHTLRIPKLGFSSVITKKIAREPHENDWNWMVDDITFRMAMVIYLVCGDWNHGILWLSIYWECHNPNWRTHIFPRGWNHQPAMLFFHPRTRTLLERSRFSGETVELSFLFHWCSLKIEILKDVFHHEKHGFCKSIRICPTCFMVEFPPICSMYGIFTYIWVIVRVNVGKYSGTMEHLGHCFMKSPCLMLKKPPKISMFSSLLSDRRTTAARANSPWALGQEGYSRPQVPRWLL